MPDESALRNEVVALTRDLIRLDTTNAPGNETRAAMLLRDYLEDAGVECELVARDPSRANLVARIPGSGGGRSLAYVGHTDVVPADARDWTHPPFEGVVDDAGYLYGRGAVDMKNEVAARAVAMANLARKGFRPDGGTYPARVTAVGEAGHASTSNQRSPGPPRCTLHWSTYYPRWSEPRWRPPFSTPPPSAT